VEAASAHAAADVTACAPSGGGAIASATPSTPPAATGPDGAFEEGRPAFQNGTFINGFHETTPIIYAETAQTMLNVADAKRLRLFVDDEPFLVEHANLLLFRRVLNMREGRLERHAIWETPAGKQVEILPVRLSSQDSFSWGTPHHGRLSLPMPPGGRSSGGLRRSRS